MSFDNNGGYGAGYGAGGNNNPYGLRIRAARRLALGKFPNAAGGSGLAGMVGGAAAPSPAQSSTVQGGSYGMGGYGGVAPDPSFFKGKGNGLRGVLKRMQAANAIYGNQALWGSIGQLSQDANRDWNEYYAEQSAPAHEQMDDAINGAKGQLTSDLMSRGLDDSSAMVGGLATLDNLRSASNAQMRLNVANQALDRRDNYQSMLRSILQNVMNGGTSSAEGIAEAQARERMMQEQLDAQNNPLGQILGGVGAVAGMTGPGGPLSGLLRKRPGFQDYWNAGIPTEGY